MTARPFRAEVEDSGAGAAIAPHLDHDFAANAAQVPRGGSPDVPLIPRAAGVKI
jgi:hypothetical protein